METRKVRNVGIGELFIPTGMFGGVIVAQGDVADVPSDLYDGLIAQPSNWQAVEDEPKAAPDKPAKPAKKESD
jgi:hypothetical protein